MSEGVPGAVGFDLDSSYRVYGPESRRKRRCFGSRVQTVPSTILRPGDPTSKTPSLQGPTRDFVGEAGV